MAYDTALASRSRRARVCAAGSVGLLLAFSLETGCTARVGHGPGDSPETTPGKDAGIADNGMDAGADTSDAEAETDAASEIEDAGSDGSTPVQDASSDASDEDPDAGPQPGMEVTIDNTAPRTEENGEIMDAHDGCLKNFAGAFYVYGTAYGPTDGFSNANRYRAYSSPDLTHWNLEGELLSDAPEGVYYRPYVVFNESTQKYVLWYNWYPTLWNGQFGVATSDTPGGPFTIQNDNVAVKYSAPGDPSLFVDEDGTGYLIYTSIDNGHGMSIEKLSSDYLSSTQESTGILAQGVEAPALFKRDDTYYALFGNLCAFCGGGSNVIVHTATSPLGPYTSQNDINGKDGQIVIPAQQTFVAEIPTTGGTAYLWMGDLWGSRPDGIKGHDLQYWSSPLAFDASGMIGTLSKVDSFTLELP